MPATPVDYASGKRNGYQCRRLVLYFLIDNSAAMTGALADAIWRSIADLTKWATEQTEPHYPIWIGMITYGASSGRLTAAVPCESLDVDGLREVAGPPAGTAFLDEGLQSLRNSLDEDLVRWGKADGDSAPVVILLGQGNYRTNMPEADYLFQALLDTVRDCTTIVLHMPGGTDEQSFGKLLWHADFYAWDETARITQRLEKEVHRFHAERQRPVAAFEPGESDNGVGSTGQMSFTGTRLLTRLLVPCLVVAVLVMLFFGVRDRVDGLWISRSRKIAYGKLIPDADGSVSATKWLELWKPLGRPESRVTIKLETYFDGIAISPVQQTRTVTGRTMRIPIPIKIVNLNSSVAHGVTGCVSLTCADGECRIIPAKLPLQASIPSVPDGATR